MNHSDSIALLSKALVAAQAEVANPSLDAVNPHFATARKGAGRYASLAEVRNTIVPVFAKHGLAIVQLPGSNERGPSLVTLLIHASGEFLESDPLILPATKQDAQGYGSALTYARRYALLALANVVGEDDDDGEVASQPVAAPVHAAKPTKPATGRELLERIKAREAQMVTAHLCQSGELLAAVQKAGNKAGLIGHLLEWPCPEPAYGVARDAIDAFERGCKGATAIQMGRIDELLVRKGQHYVALLDALALPADHAAGLDRDQASRGIAWLSSLQDVPVATGG